MFNKKPKYKIKPDYQRKNLKNPFFANQKQGRTKLWKWLVFLSVVLVGVLAWFLFLSEVWMINKINISGLTRIDEIEIKKIVFASFDEDYFLFFSKKNIFLFNKDEVLEKINSNFNFSRVEIQKIYPHTLKIVISERPYAFIYQEGNDRFFASKDAYIIKEEPVKDEDLDRYFLLENKSQAVYINQNNKIVIKSEYLDFVFALNDNMPKYPDFKVERYIIDQELNSLTVKFKDGPQVYFNVKNDAAEQLVDLDLVKKEKIGDNFSSTQYIDMRFGKMIYIH